MARAHSPSRIVPVLLGAGMILVTLLAALLPGTGAAPASGATSCEYGVCPSNNGVSPSTLELILGLLAVVALVLGLLIYRDRRRGGRQPPQEWADAGAGGAGAAAAPGPVAPYTETPEDVSVPPPVVGGAAAGGAAGAAEGEADIDSLMAELDKISGEILKRGQTPKKGGPSSEQEPKDGSG